MVVEVPFLLFALLLPVVTGGERIDVLGLSLSVSPAGRLQRARRGIARHRREHRPGLDHHDPRPAARARRLHLARQLVLISSFMVRYADVLAAEMARIEVARESRGFTATGLRASPVLSRSLGALFLGRATRRARAPRDARPRLQRHDPGPRRRPPARRGGDGARPAGPAGAIASRRRSRDRRRDRAGGTHLHGVTRRYPDGRAALNGVDLVLPARSAHALLGDGAGKTTLVLRLNGILTPTSAPSTSTVCRWRGQLQEVRRHVGIVFQDPDDPLFMPSIRKDVAFGPANLGLSADKINQRWPSARRRGHRARRRPGAAPPVVRPAPPRRRHDRPRDPTIDPRPRRAVVDPRPGEPARAGRHPARPRPDVLMVAHDLPFALELCPARSSSTPARSSPTVRRRRAGDGGLMRRPPRAALRLRPGQRHRLAQPRLTGDRLSVRCSSQGAQRRTGRPCCRPGQR